MASLRPLARASVQSSTFACNKSWASDSNKSARLLRVRFFTSVESRATSREALRAACPISIRSETVLVVISISSR